MAIINQDLGNKNEKLKKELNEQKKITDEIYLQFYRQDKVLGGLKKENEEITNKYNEGYDLIEKTKTSMEEMLDKIEKLKEENELLEKDNDLLEEENKKIKNELDDYKVFKSRFNDFVKNYHK